MSNKDFIDEIEKFLETVPVKENSIKKFLRLTITYSFLIFILPALISLVIICSVCWIFSNENNLIKFIKDNLINNIEKELTLGIFCVSFATCLFGYLFILTKI